MILNRIEDSRDALAKATRHELAQFAKANNVAEIDPEMPALLMREILRRRGLTNIKIPNRQLGAPPPRPGDGQGETMAGRSGPEVDAVDDLARQWAEQKAASGHVEREPEKPLADMNINELRKICGGLGIALSRRDNMKTMREKIEAYRG